MAYSNLSTCRTLLALSQIRGLGGQKVLRLSLNALLRDDSKLLGLSKRLSRPLSAHERQVHSDLTKQVLIPKSAWDWADQQIQQHRDIGAQIVSFYDSNYPQLLRLIPNPPPLLFSLGELQDLSQPAVALVGTRQPSPKGIQRALACGRLVAEHNLNIVSGLALGIDTLAHQVALSENAKTFALLAHGLDRLYPKENHELSRKILDAKGALISESPIGTDVNAGRLISRDRLQSGLAVATFIVETQANGGAMHAGRATLSQGRSLWLPRSSKASLDEFQRDPQVAKQISWITSSKHFKSVLNQAHTDFLNLQERGKTLWQAIQQAQQKTDLGQLNLF